MTHDKHHHTLRHMRANNFVYTISMHNLELRRHRGPTDRFYIRNRHIRGQSAIYAELQWKSI